MDRILDEVARAASWVGELGRVREFDRFAEFRAAQIARRILSYREPHDRARNIQDVFTYRGPTMAPLANEVERIERVIAADIGSAVGEFASPKSVVVVAQPKDGRR